MDRANDGLGALAAYRAVAGIDAAPEEFMKMAIDAARTFMLQAEAAISDGNRPAKAKALGSAGEDRRVHARAQRQRARTTQRLPRPSLSFCACSNPPRQRQ